MSQPYVSTIDRFDQDLHAQLPLLNKKKNMLPKPEVKKMVDELIPPEKRPLHADCRYGGLTKVRFSQLTAIQKFHLIGTRNVRVNREHELMLLEQLDHPKKIEPLKLKQELIEAQQKALPHLEQRNLRIPHGIIALSPEPGI